MIIISKCNYFSLVTDPFNFFNFTFNFIDAENYLLSCSRYIEMNPVNANMVKYPAEYKWSSYMHNAHGEFNNLVSSHEIYKRLGLSDEIRRQAFASLFETVLSTADVQVIRNAARFSMPTGDSRFKQQIERMLNRKVGYAHRGRPRVSKKSH